MRSVVQVVLGAAALLLPAQQALADDPFSGGVGPGTYAEDPAGYPQQPIQAPSYGTPGPSDPMAQVAPQPGQEMYQPPPEGVCVDESNQPYDCSSDPDYQSYSQVDDGYDPAAYQDFRDALTPYGQWVETAQYGQVWVPSQTVVGGDFTPYYSGGHWSYSDYGWTWVSDYDWGWAPFHYGRWMSLSGYGWTWIPGRVWGPAWVHWRVGGGYVGWAPLPPRGVRIAPPFLGARSSYWCFVNEGGLLSTRLNRLSPMLLPGIYARTAIASELRAIGNTRIIYGPGANRFSGLRLGAPAPLHSLHLAMPRAHVVYRPGVPLPSRPYYAPHYRQGGWGGGYQPRPGTYYPRPAPTYQPGPGHMGPGYQPGPRPAPTYQPPVRQSPTWNNPGYQPGPRPAPTYQPPVHQSPTWNNPGYQPAPRPAPTYQPPVHQSPTWNNPGYQPAPRPAPTYQPPIHNPAPSFQPAPRPAPTYTPPVDTPPPSFHSAPTPAPAPRPSPSYSPPVHTPSPSFRSAPTPSVAPSSPTPTHTVTRRGGGAY